MGRDGFGGCVTCVESGMVWWCWLMFKCESERSMLCLEGEGMMILFETVLVVVAKLWCCGVGG